VPRTLAALNTATARDGVLLRATGRASGLVHVVQRAGAGDASSTTSCASRRARA
jgi:hypothetical protein